MAVVGAAFLFAVGRALARIHVEHDDLRRSPLVHRVDPLARQIGESGEVLRPRQPLGLEAAHLAGRGAGPIGRSVADHPAHRRIAAQPLGVVHILVAGQPPEYRLPQQPDQQMPSVLAGACLRQSLATACGQTEHVVQLAIGEQSAIGGDHRTAELEHQAAVEIEPQRLAFRFTRRVRHRRPVRPRDNILNLISKSETARSKSLFYPGNAGSEGRGIRDPGSTLQISACTLAQGWPGMS